MAAQHSKAERTLVRWRFAAKAHPSRILSLALMALSMALGIALTTLSHCYSNRGPTLYQSMADPSLGLVLALSGLALGARLGSISKDSVTVICALCGAGIATLGASGPWLSIFGPLSTLRPTSQVPLALLPAATILGTGVAVMGRSLAMPSRWPTAVFFGTCAVSGGFTFLWLLHWANGSQADLARLFPPLPAMVMAACNAGFLGADLEHPAMRSFSTTSPTGASMRRIFTCSLIALMTIGTLRTMLQTYGWVNLEEGTALMVLSAVVVTGVILRKSARLLNDAWDVQEDSFLSLRREAAGRQDLVQQIDQERYQLAAVLRAASDYAIIATNLTGKVIIFNEGARLMTGYSPEEIVDSDAILLFCDPNEIVARARQLHVSPGFDVFTAIPNQGKTDAGPCTYVQKDGTRLQMWLSVTALRDRNNAISGYVGIARDISAEVRHKREREGLLKIGQELLCLADKQGYLKITSPSFLRISGYHPQDLVGRRLTDFVHPDDRIKTTHLWEQLMSGACVQRFESRWRTHDGCYRIISWDISPPESDGLVFASGWDVTDEKAHQRELERFLEFEKQIIGIVSHDLRNPIAATSLAAQAISRQKDASERIRAHAQRIYQSSERATRMIHDLLDFTQSRLGGGLRIEKHALDLTPAIGLILDELRLAHPQQHILLECPEHLILEGDADRLAQALSNIVGNSLKYGSPAHPVVVSAQQSDGSLALAVHNSGNPIPPDIIPTLFLPLRRGSSRKPDGGHSIGLGLYIANEIARAHDGYIDVQSSAEDGTTFTFHLPVGHAATSAESSKRKTS